MMTPKFHPYATDSKEREQLPVWFAILAIALSYVLHLVVEQFILICHGTLTYGIRLRSTASSIGYFLGTLGGGPSGAG